jgi:ATP:ADP antiporter, AAA family
MVLARAVAVEPGEAAPALWSFGYFFCVLASYYLLRPVRDAMGAARGTEQLPWLFTGTFLAMVLAVPVFGALAARAPRRTLLPLVYAFFIACILLLFALLSGAAAPSWAPAAFFIWLSVFNLFVVSVFWSFMADVWREDQARRVFGFIAAGGSAGALLAPAFAAAMAPRIGPVNLLPIAAAILAGALLCIARLRRRAVARGAATDDATAVGGGALAGITLVLRSRYLLGICVFMALATTLSTFVYFLQAHIVRGAYADLAERTAVFATMDLAVNALTIGTQLFVTARLIARLGLPRTLPFLPALSLAGFATLVAAPTAAVLVTFQVARRAAQYAITGPARELLHGRDAGGEVQGEEFHRHRGLSWGRRCQQLGICWADRPRTGNDRSGADRAALDGRLDRGGGVPGPRRGATAQRGAPPDDRGAPLQRISVVTVRRDKL